MKKFLFSILITFSLALGSYAKSLPDEGMWLPIFIERLNFVDMQKMGLHLTSEELYSINNSSLKDAIVGLAKGSAPAGYFCTAEVVSSKGLLFTNHHCGLDAIQDQSSLDNNYIKNGFWAKNYQEELLNEGMTASFLVRMEDVTSKALEEVKTDMTEEERSLAIRTVTSKLEDEASEDGEYDAVVKSFFGGNEYYLIVYKTYKDVRLVGAPPSSIGKYGGDTDNWEWPRHTGDFTVLRIYTAPDGSPATYSEKNIPLKPKHHLPVSIKGVKKGDFAMIWGYPGRTDRYLTSYGVQLAVEESNPTVVKIREKKLEIMKEDMNANDKVKIQYTSKYAETSNFWKYFIGQTRGLKRLKVYDRKIELEDELQKWIKADTKRTEKYGEAIDLISSGYNDLKRYNIHLKYLEEVVFQGPEFVYYSFNIFGLYSQLKTQKESKGKEKSNYVDMIKNSAEMIKEELGDFFKNYNQPTDKKLFGELVKMYYENIPKDQLPEVFEIVDKKFKGDFAKYTDYVFEKSIFVDKTKFEAFLDKPSFKTLNKDPGLQITRSMVNVIRSIYGELGSIETKIDKGNRLFIAALREMNPDRVYYPDANSSLRMTYGRVLDYIPADAVHYDYITYLSGVMEKEDPTNEEFIVEKKLKELYLNKDYGRYGENGKMTVCFLTDHDISGGNSGSPVINADGHLIGIAFDGNWEAMSGDINFEQKIQRTINVDIRYVLFVIEKLAGAGYLIDEMTIIENTPLPVEKEAVVAPADATK